jgi:hypothetical protein
MKLWKLKSRSPARPENFLVEIGKKCLGGNKGPLILGDAMNLEIPDTRDLHLPLRT